MSEGPQDCVTVILDPSDFEDPFEAGFKAGFMRAVQMIGSPEQRQMAKDWFEGDDSLLVFEDGQPRLRSKP